MLGMLSFMACHLLITGGGEEFESAMAHLRELLPFGSEKSWSFRYCGEGYQQDPVTFEISRDQREYAESLVEVDMGNWKHDMIGKEPAIDLAYGTTGEVDAVLLGNFADMEEYSAVCDRLLNDNPHVERYTTLFAVDRYKESSAIPTDALSAKLQD